MFRQMMDLQVHEGRTLKSAQCLLGKEIGEGIGGGLVNVYHVFPGKLTWKLKITTWKLKITQFEKGNHLANLHF